MGTAGDTTKAAFERRRREHRELASELVPEMLARIEWPQERIAELRQQALRGLLTRAKEGSRWHRGRLEGIDPSTFTLEELASLPTMTKEDLMANFDAIATDPRITRARCEEHIAGDDIYLDGEFLVFASGGSSGVRALGVTHWRSAAVGWASLTRFLMRWARRTQAFDAPGPPATAIIGAGPGPHASHVHGRIFGDTRGPQLSVLHPLADIVAALNAAPPDHLIAYASFIPVLVDAARAGRLHIRPKLLSPAAEPFLPEHRHSAVETWRCAVMTSWGATETGLLGGGSGFDDGMLLYDDCAIIEPVDGAGRPVPPGEQAHKLLVTPLNRMTLPVIRYEITDQLTVLDEPASCGATFTRTTEVVGRLDDQFVYPGALTVHPHVFRTVLGSDPEVREYQVRQTGRGAEISVMASDAVDEVALSGRIEGRLARLGLADPEVRVTRVEQLERSGSAAKLRRFVPLAASDA